VVVRVMSCLRSSRWSIAYHGEADGPFLDYLRVIDLGAVRAADISNTDLGAIWRYPD